MSKPHRPDLSALAEAGGGRARQVEAKLEDPSPIAPQRKGQKGREGMVPITVLQPEAVRTQIKLIALEHGTTIENLAGEAFNSIFAKYGKPEIAVVKRKGKAA